MHVKSFESVVRNSRSCVTKPSTNAPFDSSRP
jgi:hypothetical protein